MASSRCFRDLPWSHAVEPIRHPALVARLNRSRLSFGQPPVMTSGGPPPDASAPAGYISAVSIKLMPVSAALSRIRCDSFSSVCFPNVPVPIHMRETVRAVLPNFVKFMLDLRKAAIHKELCSCDEAGLIASQKDHRAGNLFRP